MGIITTIQVRAFFMLLVFASGLAAVCHCNHTLAAKSRPVVAGHDCCKKMEEKKCTPEKYPSGENKGGCCEGKLVSLNSLAKLTAEKVDINHVFIIALVQHYFTPVINIPSANLLLTSLKKGKWRTNPSPDLLILNRRFLI